MNGLEALIILFVIGCMIAIPVTIIHYGEKYETENFWKCHDKGGTIEYCIDAFEHDYDETIEIFNRCLVEIGDLEYCHETFLE